MADDAPSSLQVVPDFIFGTLGTDELRLQQLRRERVGVWHQHKLLPSSPRPRQPVRLEVSVGPAVAADHVSLYFTTDGSAPAGSRGVAGTGTVVQLQRFATEWDTLIWGYRDCWEGFIPPQPAGTLVRYQIEAWHSVVDRSWHVDDDPARVFAFTEDEEQVPAWLREAVIYQIFVDRFAPDPGNDFAVPDDRLGGFYGGTLRGVTSRLDYLHELGVDCLWLTPIFPSPSHHGYDTTDYGSVEPRLGTDADLQALLAAAHERGIRVLFDYVANHMSSRHPAFLSALQSPDAATASWFSWEQWPTHYRSFFGVQEMPQINTDDPAARDYLIEHACAWLRRGCDGFRLDYANGPSHQFWTMFRTATRQVNGESVTIGEVVETPELQRSYAGRMDGCLDFLLLQALRGFFAFHTLKVSEFDVFLRRHLAYFSADLVLPSFLDNHDMNRFLWAVGGDRRRLSLAALCQFTLPGPPIIYYGTEVGLNQERDVRYADGSGHPEEARLPMLWDAAQDQDLRRFYRALIALRKEAGASWEAERKTLLVDDEQRLYGYACGRYAVILNNQAAQVRAVLSGWQDATVALQTDPGCAWQPDDGTVQLPPYGGICLRSS